MELITKTKTRLDKAARLPDLWAQEILDNAAALEKVLNPKTDAERAEIMENADGAISPAVIFSIGHINRLLKQLRKKEDLPEEQPIALQVITETDIFNQDLPKGKRAAFIFTGATNYGILRVFKDRKLAPGSEEEPFIEKRFTPDYGLLVTVENASRFTLSQTISSRRVCLLATY